MKTVLWKKTFRKDFKKLNKRQKKAWAEVFKHFKQFPHDRSLRRHKLSGRYEGLESIDVLPDLRALFLEEGDFLVFYYIRNHNQLYH